MRLRSTKMSWVLRLTQCRHKTVEVKVGIAYNLNYPNLTPSPGPAGGSYADIERSQCKP